MSEGWGVWGVRALSLQPQELLYCWGEAGPGRPRVELGPRATAVGSVVVRPHPPLCDGDVGAGAAAVASASAEGASGSLPAPHSPRLALFGCRTVQSRAPPAPRVLQQPPPAAPEPPAPALLPRSSRGLGTAPALCLPRPSPAVPHRAPYSGLRVP